VTQILAVKMHPLRKGIPRFIQMNMLLPPLKPMAQSGRGVTHSVNKSWYNLCQWVRLLLHSLNYPTLKADGSIKAWGDQYSGGKGAPSGSGYTKIYSNRSTLIKPLALRAAKALEVE
jgi:hypothetical protein